MGDSEENSGNYRITTNEHADCAIPGTGRHSYDVRIEAEDEVTMQKLKATIGDQQSVQPEKSPGLSVMNKKLLFISHAESDKEVAKKLVELVLAALDLEDDEVLCTSVPGHKLKVGKLVTPQLKDGIDICAVIIVLITEKSLQSKWVLFELGASWALDKIIIPILAPKLTENDLPGPLSQYACIKIDASDASSDLIAGLEQVAAELNVSEKSGPKRQTKLEEFVETFKAYKREPSHDETGSAIGELQSRTDQLKKEMDQLVAPLYSKISKDKDGTYRGFNYIFMKGSPGYRDSHRPRDREFFEFWQSIRQNMYLAQGELYSVLETYLDRKSNTVGDRGQGDPLYMDAEKKLIEAIVKRYSELIEKIKTY